MAGQANHFGAIALVLGTSLAASVVAPLLRAPAIIGYLVAGVILGPSGTALIRGEEVNTLAELGLVLLLFTVGLELSPTPLIEMGRRLLIATAIQMGTTAAAVAVALVIFGADWLAAGLVGVAASLSSTAIVLRHLSDRGEAESPAGVVTVGMLLVQDIVVITVCSSSTRETSPSRSASLTST